jgi:hypothetical protein
MWQDILCFNSFQKCEWCWRKILFSIHCLRTLSTNTMCFQFVEYQSTAVFPPETLATSRHGRQTVATAANLGHWKPQWLWFPTWLRHRSPVANSERVSCFWTTSSWFCSHKEVDQQHKQVHQTALPKQAVLREIRGVVEIQTKHDNKLGSRIHLGGMRVLLTKWIWGGKKRTKIWTTATASLFIFLRSVHFFHSTRTSKNHWI